MKNGMIYIGSKRNKLILWTTTNYWIYLFFWTVLQITTILFEIIKNPL